MTIRRTLHRVPTRIGALLAALALFVRLVVPAGFMPMASASGAPTLVICTGQGPMVMPMPAGKPMAGMEHHQAPSDGDTASHGCFLAAVGGAVDIAAPAASIPLPFIVAVEHVVRAFVTRPGRGLAAPPPPKTGPPILA